MANLGAILGPQVFNLLQLTSQSDISPDVAATSTLALTILNDVLVKRSKDRELVAIARDLCMVVANVAHRAKSASSIDLELEFDNTQELVREINRTKDFLECDMKEKGLWDRINTVQKCRDTVQHLQDLLGLQSEMELQKQLAILNARLVELLEYQRRSPPSSGPQTCSISQNHLPASPERSTSAPVEESQLGNSRVFAPQANINDPQSNQLPTTLLMPGDDTAHRHTFTAGGDISSSHVNGTVSNMTIENTFHVGGTGPTNVHFYLK